MKINLFGGSCNYTLKINILKIDNQLMKILYFCHELSCLNFIFLIFFLKLNKSIQNELDVKSVQYAGYHDSFYIYIYIY